MDPFIFPEFDPIAIEIGPLAIRWYALSYVIGLVLAWRYALRLSRLPPNLVTPRQVDDFLVWATLGVVIGARLGLVLFYQPSYYLSHPSEILQVWRGGMSFHGGFVAVVLAMIIYARRHGIPLLAFTDLWGAAAPIGLILGRIANFINGELWGRTTDVPWGVVFPGGGDLPRHPSQLYQSALEGLLLFVVLAVLIHSRRQPLRRPGLITGVFIGGYGAARIFVEFFRQPDRYIGTGGFLVAGTTWGQWLSLPLVAGGIYLVWRALKRPRESGS